MAGIRWPPEDSDFFPARPPAAGAGAAAAADLTSDDDRSVAADSWSIKSDYGSNLDEEQRQADAAEVLAGGHFRAASDYSSDKEVLDNTDVEASVAGLLDYGNVSYAEDIASFHKHDHAGEVWFGIEVMAVLVSWAKHLCSKQEGQHATPVGDCGTGSDDTLKKLSDWNVLDIGTGNGRLLQELAKQGFSDLTGIDYSEETIEAARNLAIRDGFTHINFLVDDILDTRLDRKFQLVMDKGTLDTFGLSADGPVKRMMYWESACNLVAPGGILVITSCNKRKDELLREVESFNNRKLGSSSMGTDGQAISGLAGAFQYLDHVKNYPNVVSGGVEGSCITTIAFIRE